MAGRRAAIGCVAMNNPLCILQTLDRHLTRPAELTLLNDLADIHFLLCQEPMTADTLRAAFHRARIPDVPEIHELFMATQPKVLPLAAKI